MCVCYNKEKIVGIRTWKTFAFDNNLLYPVFSTQRKIPFQYGLNIFDNSLTDKNHSGFNSFLHEKDAFNVLIQRWNLRTNCEYVICPVILNKEIHSGTLQSRSEDIQSLDPPAMESYSGRLMLIPSYKEVLHWKKVTEQKITEYIKSKIVYRGSDIFDQHALRLGFKRW